MEKLPGVMQTLKEQKGPSIYQDLEEGLEHKCDEKQLGKLGGHSAWRKGGSGCRSPSSQLPNRRVYPEGGNQALLPGNTQDKRK